MIQKKNKTLIKIAKLFHGCNYFELAPRDRSIVCLLQLYLEVDSVGYIKGV